MTRRELEQAYENMMYHYGEFDTFDDDIKPKFKAWSLEELKRNYKADKAFYKKRELAGGCF